MITAFRPLFTLAVSHAFYEGSCPDFAYVQPSATAAALAGARSMARDRDGVLYALYEANAAGDGPLVSLAGQMLRFGLRLTMPYFANYTAVDAAFPRSALRYTNVADANALAADGTAAVVGDTLRHAIAQNARPVTLSLRDAAGNVLATQTVPDQRTDVGFDLRGVSAGPMVVREKAGANTADADYFHDAELQALGVVVIVEIAVADGFYDAPPSFEIAFDARADVLRFFVVARNYTDAEFAQLGVADVGFAADARPEIKFTRVAANALDAGEAPFAPIPGQGERLVLFRSQAPLARRLRPRQRLQLSRQNEVLVANLPNPGADRARADLIVHVSKP